MALVAIACGRPATQASLLPTQPTDPNFTVAVTSPRVNVLFGQTEAVTATASDGRPLTGTWSTDNVSVATVSSTPGSSAIVTPTGAGQVNIMFTAGTGQTGHTSLRILPDLSG